MRTTSPLHAVTWLLWALAAAYSVQLAPSPVYVALVVAVAFAVASAHRLDGTLARAFPVLVGLGIAFALIRVVLTALTTHTGVEGGPTPSDTWFTLPSGTLPRILGGFTVGGTIEASVVLQSAAQAFAVVGILAVFGAFNAVASHHELLQSSPRAFHEPGLIVSVALAFVPSTMAAVTATREADRARTGGRVVRRGRLVRLTVPIVESGLERAMALAESMDARGFARLDRSRGDRIAGWLGFGSMVALAGSFLALVGQSSAWAEDGRGTTLAAVFGGLGLVGLIVAVALSSTGTRTTRYRPRPFTRLDGAVMATAVATAAGITIVSVLTDDPLYWSAYPLRFPTFSVWPAACLLLLAAPILVPPRAVGPDGTSTDADADAEARTAHHVGAAS